MAGSAPEKRAGSRTGELVLRILILGLCYVLALLPRLIAVARFESVIHEFDPYFNYRSTKHLVEEGFSSFLNWFDDRSWYPLGRIVGGTIYPGLMAASASFFWALNAINLNVKLVDVCVYLSPFFAANTTLVTYYLGKEVAGGDRGVGLVAAVLVSVVPGYIQRSVAGSYDNEGIAIFALMLTFYWFIRAVNSGSLSHCAAACLSYAGLVSTWGGHIFVMNLIPLYVLVLLLAGRYSERLWIAFSTFYVVGSLLSMQVPFVGFLAVSAAEYLLAMATFVVLQGFAASSFVKQHIPASHQTPELLASAKRVLFRAAGAILLSIVCLSLVTGYRPLWTGRFWALVDPTYASRMLPLIASVSEHQPAAWTSFFFDLHIITFLIPAGMYRCLQKPTDANIFLVVLVMSSVYFASIMVRLIVVLAPCACVLAAVALSHTLRVYTAQLRRVGGGGRRQQEMPSQWEVSVLMVILMAVLVVLYVVHSVWATSEAYSSPSIVLSAKSADGSSIVFDDYREAYAWLRHNTPQDAKVMSWWDYGYQVSAIANRTTIVDNNTWNNTHIATVALAFASAENQAIKVLEMLSVDYVMVVFGGMTGMASDDMNKFLWMARVAQGVFDGKTSVAGMTPVVTAAEYGIGGITVGEDGSPQLHRSLLYKLSYYRFGGMQTEYGKPAGYDRVRQEEVGVKDIELKHLEEVYTTQHWLVRIYKVNKDNQFR